MGESEHKEQSERGEALLDLLARGSELTRQLLDETEALRRGLAAVPDPGAGDGSGAAREQVALGDWMARLHALQNENQALLARLRSAETESRSWAERHAESEERNDELANLYVASYQLHATLDPEEVVAAISEIVINLVGAEVFALYGPGEREGCLDPVIGAGRPRTDFPVLAADAGRVGEAITGRRVCVAADALDCGLGGPGGEPVVVIPLLCRGTALGAIAIFSFLPQKTWLSELDRQLFELLASQAAPALACARLQPAPISVLDLSPALSDRNPN
jgi:GAF domain